MIFTPARLGRRAFLSRSSWLFGGAALDLASAPSPGPPRSARSQNLKRVMESCYAAYGELDIEKVLSFYAENCIFEDHTFHLSLHGKAQVREMLQRNRPLVFEIHFEVHNMIISGNWVVTQHLQSGLTQPPKQPGVRARYAVRGASVFEFERGKIKRQTDYYDVATFKQQVGLPG
jgi:steroid delta-isomerase-like uncharacterized protein